MSSALSSKLLVGVAERYLCWRAHIDYGLLWSVGTAVMFFKLGLRALGGHLKVIETDLVTSRVGYKYLEILVTKTPVSNVNTYEDIKL